MQKDELLMKIREGRKKVESLCAESDLERPLQPHSEWTLKSVLAHLAFWEHATLDVRSGNKTAESLKNVSAINSDLLTKTKTRGANDVLLEFARSGERVTQQIQDLSEEELQAPSPWGDGVPLVEHLADDTCVHYQEHLRRMK